MVQEWNLVEHHMRLIEMKMCYRLYQQIDFDRTGNLRTIY